MEHKRRTEKKLSGEELSRHILKIFERRGNKALDIAKRKVLEEAEKLECKEAREALKYFMNERWKETTRAALLSIACEALGGKPNVTTPIAVPLILIGGAVDIHDDIIDKTKRKRNRLTVYGKFGEEIALLVGDALLLKGLCLLYEASKEIPQDKMQDIFEVLKSFFFEMGDAEALEVSLRRRTLLTVDEYMNFVRKKAAELEAYMRISAILADGSRKEIEALSRYGRILGMLVIMGDDNADMLNPTDVLNRIKNEVLPFPIIYALNKPQVKEKLMPILQKKKLTRKDAETIFHIIYKAKVFDEIGTFFTKLINEGRKALIPIKQNKLLILILESTYPRNKA
jgi:geranylgeranyl pyrophosphate synthase